MKTMTPSRKSEKRFSLIETFKKFDNPFTESQPDLISIVPKEVISEKAAKLSEMFTVLVNGNVQTL